MQRHGVAHVLLQLMSADGTPPPSRLPPPPPPGEDNELLDNLFMVGRLRYSLICMKSYTNRNRKINEKKYSGKDNELLDNLFVVGYFLKLHFL